LHCLVAVESQLLQRIKALERLKALKLVAGQVQELQVVCHSHEILRPSGDLSQLVIP